VTAPAQPDAWGLNGSRSPERAPGLERSTSG
jgi:hypothetical protein